MPTIKTLIKYSINGKVQLPHPNVDELADSYIEGPYRLTIPQETANQSISLANKGTIKRILVWVDNGVPDISLLVNGAQVIEVNPVILLSDGVTALSVSNASDADDWDVWIAIVYT